MIGSKKIRCIDMDCYIKGLLWYFDEYLVCRFYLIWYYVRFDICVIRSKGKLIWVVRKISVWIRNNIVISGIMKLII